MIGQNKSPMKWEEARAVLAVGPDASVEQVRAAYLEQVRKYPPDREPDQFERVRDAYDCLRDPKAKVKQVLEGPEPNAPLTSVAGPVHMKRRFVRVAAWMAALKEKRS